MLNISLNLIGIILIIYSIFVIKNDLLKNNLKSEDLITIEENIRHYHDSTNDVISSFNELVELKLEKIDDEKDNQLKEENILNIESKDITKLVNDSVEKDKIPKKINPIYEKVIDLLEIGLTKEEIAKKMNKGIREIDIIIKMYNK